MVSDALLVATANARIDAALARIKDQWSPGYVFPSWDDAQRLAQKVDAATDHHACAGAQVNECSICSGDDDA